MALAATDNDHPPHNDDDEEDGLGGEGGMEGCWGGDEGREFWKGENIDSHSLSPLTLFEPLMLPSII